MGDSKEHVFWHWFVNHEDALFTIDAKQRDILDILAEQLEKVDPDLTFEIGSNAGGQREFVITAGGLKRAFSAVEALAVAAPVLPRWKVTKFRPRRSPMTTIHFAGKTISPNEVETTLLSNGSEIGVYLFFKEYAEGERKIWGQIAYLLLDEALGEYDVETKVGLIDYMRADEHSDARRVSATDLAPWFDEKFASLKQ